eukprot:63019-Amphidinium_carterae.1
MARTTVTCRSPQQPLCMRAHAVVGIVTTSCQRQSVSSGSTVPANSTPRSLSICGESSCGNEISVHCWHCHTMMGLVQ